MTSDLNSTSAAVFAPTGRLRAVLNMGNTLLAHSATSSERPAGVSIDIAREFGRQLGVPVDLLPVDLPPKAVEAMASGQADLGFLAVDPLRAKDLYFTRPYVVLRGCYAVPQGSSITSSAEIDRPGHTVVAVAGSAYALYLQRHLRHASLVTIGEAAGTVRHMLEGRHTAVAGVRQMLQTEVASSPAVRMLADDFMEIPQAVAMPKGRGADAQRQLDDFVSALVASGFIDQAFARHAVLG